MHVDEKDEEASEILCNIVATKIGIIYCIVLCYLRARQCNSCIPVIIIMVIIIIIDLEQKCVPIANKIVKSLKMIF